MTSCQSLGHPHSVGPSCCFPTNHGMSCQFQILVWVPLTHLVFQLDHHWQRTSHVLLVQFWHQSQCLFHVVQPHLVACCSATSHEISDRSLLQIWGLMKTLPFPIAVPTVVSFPHQFLFFRLGHHWQHTSRGPLVQSWRQSQCQFHAALLHLEACCSAT